MWKRFGLVCTALMALTATAQAERSRIAEACTVPLGPTQGLNRPASTLQRIGLFENLGPARHQRQCRTADTGLAARRT